MKYYAVDEYQVKLAATREADEMPEDTDRLTWFESLDGVREYIRKIKTGRPYMPFLNVVTE